MQSFSAGFPSTRKKAKSQPSTAVVILEGAVAARACSDVSIGTKKIVQNLAVKSEFVLYLCEIFSLRQMWNNDLRSLWNVPLTRNVKWNKFPHAHRHFTWRQPYFTPVRHFTNPVRDSFRWKKHPHGCFFLCLHPRFDTRYPFITVGSQVFRLVPIVIFMETIRYQRTAQRSPAVLQ